MKEERRKQKAAKYEVEDELRRLKEEWNNDIKRLDNANEEIEVNA